MDIQEPAKQNQVCWVLGREINLQQCIQKSVHFYFREIRTAVKESIFFRPVVWGFYFFLAGKEILSIPQSKISVLYPTSLEDYAFSTGGPIPRRLPNL